VLKSVDGGLAFQPLYGFEKVRRSFLAHHPIGSQCVLSLVHHFSPLMRALSRRSPNASAIVTIKVIIGSVFSL
jgi:hypothetical protein